eukprot:TRINITY_DN29249_c0_g1_i3.p1 TRINITY_DN29249_c0_g1~~TRINITY_DN29249_c0_g1_i3.p1  ORF type:complete len:323 (-),score=42.84 TRINITY_DN29249_c0_g1_i3:86-1054(-)
MVCPVCEGSGKLLDDICPLCDGQDNDWDDLESADNAPDNVIEICDDSTTRDRCASSLELAARHAAETVFSTVAEPSLAELNRLTGQTVLILVRKCGTAHEKLALQLAARKACHERLVERGLTARPMAFFSKSKCSDDLEIGQCEWRQILSNFHVLKTPLQCWGRRYFSVEHGYQAAKFLYAAFPRQLAEEVALELEAERPMGRVAPLEAKMFGAKRGMQKCGCELDVDAWEKSSDSVMRSLLEARWASDPDFRRILFEAKRQRVHLVHFERSGASSYWGGCIKDGDILGQNKLGEMLMELAARGSEGSQGDGNMKQCFVIDV